MEIAIYQVDAFAPEVFSGNPAAVCVLDGWVEDRILQGIAAENNLSETAFLVAGAGGFDLRWFTPKVEVALCGHATLAAAKVLYDARGWVGERIRFRTRWKGELAVEKRGEWFEMDFPALPARPAGTPDGLGAALGAEPRQVLESDEDWLAVMDDEETVRGLAPDFRALERYECRCIVPTARGAGEGGFRFAGVSAEAGDRRRSGDGVVALRAGAVLGSGAGEGGAAGAAGVGAGRGDPLPERGGEGEVGGPGGAVSGGADTRLRLAGGGKRRGWQRRDKAAKR